MRKLTLLSVLVAVIVCLASFAGLADGPKPDQDGSLRLERNLAALSPEAHRKVSPELLQQFAEQGADPQRRGASSAPITFLVYLRDRAPLADLKQAPTLDARRAAVVSTLRDAALRSQPAVRSLLDAQQRSGHIAGYRSYWVFNGFAVDGDLEAALALAALPEVEFVRPNRVHRLPPRPQGSDGYLAANPEWNISHIGADQVWAVYGVTGRGVVVANMDTGVDWSHPGLQRSYRGYNASDPGASSHNYNWFDPTGTYPSAPGPNQPKLSRYSDHGTHVMGTIVGRELDGSNAVGVAPGAQWIAIKIFDDAGESSDEWIHAGFQWCLAPTDLQGRNPNPSLAPDVVGNSWGDDNGSDETFRPDWEAWQAAGIFSAWAAGNEGPSSRTVNSPGSFPGALSVGATNSVDGIASFSSRGPSPWNEIKPEVAAPGASIRSTIAGGLYEGGWNGTSMATPHVAGLAALLMEAAHGNLTITETRTLIMQSAVDLGDAGPDNLYGHGRIDAMEAVGALLATGTFAGRVTEQGSGEPLEGVTVMLENHGTNGRASTTTAADGAYSLSVREGSYDVTASKFGYESYTALDIQIQAHTTTLLDFGLNALPRGALAGRVLSSQGGLPVPCVVKALGTPVTETVDLDGYYALSLPAGTYALQAEPLQVGHRGVVQSGVQVAAGVTTTLDLTLQPIPRILVVDAEADETETVLPIYAQALEALLYGHDLWTNLDALPEAAHLEGYDVVIWAQPFYSPGRYDDHWPALTSFMDDGGGLLLTGQDIGYWDAGRAYAPEPYANYLHASYVADTAGLTSLRGLAGSILEGISLDFNTSDSLYNQATPDVLAPRDALAEPLLANDDGDQVALILDACDYRLIYLGFGFEGVGPASSRIPALQAMVDWLGNGGEDPRLVLSAPVDAKSAVPGATASYDVQIVNRTDQPDRLTLSVASPEWPASVVDPTTLRPMTETRTLQPCEVITVKLQVSVPEMALINQGQTSRLIVTPQSAGYLSAALEVATTAFGAWRPGAPMSEPRYRHSVEGLDCHIYLFGGYDAADDLVNSALRLDLRTGAWQPLATPLISAGNSASAVLNGKIYLLGGYDPEAGSPYLDAVQVYDPAIDRWSSAAALPMPLSGASAATVGGRIYLVGGSSPTGESRAAYAYDPGVGAWNRLADAPVSDLAFSRAVALNENVYVAGGWPSQPYLLRYDPAQNAWQRLSNMQVGRTSFAFLTDGRYLYAAGGGSAWDGLRQAERYDPQADSWLGLPTLAEIARSGADGAYLDGRLYVLGGSDDLDTTASVEWLEVAPVLNGSGASVSAKVVQPGGVLDYQVLLRNPADESVPARWIHRIPPYLTHVPGSATNGAAYSEADGTVSWEGVLPSGGVAAFTFSSQVAIDAPLGDEIESQVAVSSDGCTPRQWSFHTMVMEPNISRSLKLAEPSRVTPGDSIRYTIEVINDTPFTIAEASVVDPIPEHTAYVPDSVQGGTFNPSLNRVEWTGQVPPAPPPGASFGWIDMTAGQDLDLGDDDCVGPIDLGFSFDFYGETHSQIYVNSNGLVLFDGCATDFGNVSIPTADEPNNFIAPFWDDLNPSAGAGGVYFGTVGSAPNRTAVIEWHQVHSYGQDEAHTFQVLMHEGTHSVVLQYLTMEGERGAGSGATVGIEDASGTAGVEHLYDGYPASNQLHNGLALEMPHTSTIKQSVHVISFEVTLDGTAPPLTTITNTATISDGAKVFQRAASVTAESPDLSTSTKRVEPMRVLAGGLVTYTIEISNTGDLTATQASLLDPLPVEISFVEGSLVGEGATYEPETRRILWEGQLGPQGDSTALSFQARVTDTLPVNSWITNTACLQERGVPMAELEAGLLVNDVDLAQSVKRASASQLRAGSEVTYTIEIANSGLHQASQVTITDTLPAELEYVPGTLAGGEYAEEDRSVRWQGQVDSDSTHQISFRARLNPQIRDGQPVTNTALIDDGHGASLVRSASLQSLRGDLSQSDMVVFPPWGDPGDSFEYRIRLRNMGSSHLGAHVVDALPVELTALPASAYASSGQVGLTERALEWIGAIPAQGMVIIRFRATLSTSVSAGVLANEAVWIDEGELSQPMIAYLQVSPEVMFLPLLYKR